MRSILFRLNQARRPLHHAVFSPDTLLLLLAALIGTAGGLVAVGFDWLVEFSSHFFYAWLTSEGFTPTNLGLLVVLPGLGGLLVGLFLRFVVRGHASHGVPDVVEAIARYQGKIPGRAGLYKAITASITIGSGGSAGVEAPIILIGASLASLIGRFFRVTRAHSQTLLGCGAAACMASIFNAPIAGVIFVLEILLRDFSVRTFTPIVVASVFGTAMTQAVLGENTAVFSVAGTMRNYAFEFHELIAYAGLGVLCGGLGAVFIRVMWHSDRLWRQVPGPNWLKPMYGGLILGVLGVGFVLAMPRMVPHGDPPPFFSNGYRVIESMLDPAVYRGGGSESPSPAVGSASVADGGARPPALGHVTVVGILVILAMKFIGTALTIGSGGSGGVIAPSLFMGAMLGGGFALGLEMLGIFPGHTPATYALAGMAGLLAATAHAPLTAFLMVFEITQDYKAILPMMLVAILATVGSQLIAPDSVFMIWIRAKGIRMGSHADMTLLRHLEVEDVPLLPPVVVRPADPVQRLVNLAMDDSAVDFVVTDDSGHRYLGMVVGQDVRTALLQPEAIPLMIVEELMRTDLPACDLEETLDVALDKFSQHEVASLAVVDRDGRLRGVLSRARLMRQYQRLLDQRG